MDKTLINEIAERQIKKEKILNEWRKLGIDISQGANSWEEYDLALALRNQWSYDKSDSMSLAWKIWNLMTLNDWISIQSMFEIEDYVYYIDNGEMKKEKIQTKDHAYLMNEPLTINNVIKKTLSIAQKINSKIQRNILNDLRNNAKTVSVWDFNNVLGYTVKEKFNSLLDMKNEVCLHMKNEYNKNPTWIS